MGWFSSKNSDGDYIKIVYIRYDRKRVTQKWKYGNEYYNTLEEASGAAFEDGATEVHMVNL